jgi:hypothetical protein
MNRNYDSKDTQEILETIKTLFKLFVNNRDSTKHDGIILSQL